MEGPMESEKVQSRLFIEGPMFAGIRTTSGSYILACCSRNSRKCYSLPFLTINISSYLTPSCHPYILHLTWTLLRVRALSMDFLTIHPRPPTHLVHRIQVYWTFPSYLLTLVVQEGSWNICQSTLLNISAVQGLVMLVCGTNFLKLFFPFYLAIIYIIKPKLQSRSRMRYEYRLTIILRWTDCGGNCFPEPKHPSHSC